MMVKINPAQGAYVVLGVISFARVAGETAS